MGKNNLAFPILLSSKTYQDAIMNHSGHTPLTELLAIPGARVLGPRSSKQNRNIIGPEIKTSRSKPISATCY